MIQIAEPNGLKELDKNRGWNNIYISYSIYDELSEKADGDDSEIKHENSCYIWGSYEDSHRIGQGSNNKEIYQRNILELCAHSFKWQILTYQNPNNRDEDTDKIEVEIRDCVPGDEWDGLIIPQENQRQPASRDQDC